MRDNRIHGERRPLIACSVLDGSRSGGAPAEWKIWKGELATTSGEAAAVFLDGLYSLSSFFHFHGVFFLVVYSLLYCY